MSFDFGRHSEDYATHRPGFPPDFYRRLDSIAEIRGSRCLDLATGPGTVALELATRGASVLGLDVSPNQVATAARVARERGLEGVATFAVSTAEKTGVEAGGFDLVTAGQCWHWFDGRAALQEAARVLRPRGVLAIAEFSYLAAHSALARETEALVLEFHPAWTMAGWTGMFPERIDELVQAGFQRVEAFCTHHDQEFSHAAWRGRMRTCSGVGSGRLSPSDVERFDEALGRLLSEKYPDPVSVLHRVWCVIGRKPTR